MKFSHHLDLKGSCIKIVQGTWIRKRPQENVTGSHQNLVFVISNYCTITLSMAHMKHLDLLLQLLKIYSCR